MIHIDIFLLGLLITSVATGLTTEAIKKIFAEYGATYRSNTIAGITAVCLSIGLGVSYVIVNALSFNAQTITSIAALIFTSWLCSMVGYDKVIQAIEQFKMYK